MFAVEPKSNAYEFPTLSDVLVARKQIQPYLNPTPLFHYPALSNLIGTDTWVKHENHQPVGAFKVRGGVNLISRLGEHERARAVITASTGNHGQSVAYASKLFGVHAIICVPEQANPAKVESIRALGAELVFHGNTFDEARSKCEQLAAEKSYRYIHSGNEPLLIAGVATATLELLTSNPDIDVIFVPVGGGSGAAGACIVAKAIRGKRVQVIAVQSEEAPAAYISWKERRIATAPSSTCAEGLATGVGFELPQQILWERLDDFVLVSDHEIRRATALMIEKTRNLVEPAGAASLAGALKMKEQIRGKRVALICTGANISTAQLMHLPFST
jgi:threonine dehydratase